MKVDIKSVSPVKKELSITVPEEMVNEEIDSAYKKVGKQARVPGFRPGKIPRALLEKRYGPSVEAEVFEELVRKTVIEALEKHDLQIVASPQITAPKREKGKGFSYKASIEVKPSFEPKNYTDIKIGAPKDKVTDKQIQEVMERLQDGQAVLKDREGATTPVTGDFVSLLLQETDAAGNVIQGDHVPNEQLAEFKPKSMQPDIEKALQKLTIGETTSVTLRAPTTSDKKMKGKEQYAKLTLNGIKEKIRPTLNDEFAKSIGPFENFEALKKRVVDDLQKEVEEKAKAEQIQELLAELIASNPIDLPESLIENETHNLMHGFLSELQRSGVKEVPKEYSQENLKKKFSPDAARRVHEQLLLEAISRKEKIEVEMKEVADHLNQIATAAKIPLAEVRAQYEKSGQLDNIRFRILAQKTLDFLLSKAKIK